MIDAGLMVGQRAFSTGPGIFWTWNPQTIDEARSIIEKYVIDYRTPWIKLYEAGDRRQRQWYAIVCQQLGVTPTAHVVDRLQSLSVAHDGIGHEHWIIGNPIGDDVVKLVARSGITYSPTLTSVFGGGGNGESYFRSKERIHDDVKARNFIPPTLIDSWSRPPGLDTRLERHTFQRVAADATAILRAGGLVTTGSHGTTPGAGLHWNIWALVMGGAIPMEALRSATIHGARALGLEQDLGSIEEGKLADLIVLEKNPLDNIRNTKTIRYVMKNGRLYDGNTLDEVWPTQRRTWIPWWRADEPAQNSGLKNSWRDLPNEKSE